MTKIGFVHVPGADLFGDSSARSGPLVMSRLGMIERTAFSEIIVDGGGDASANFALAAEILQRTESLRIVLSLPLFELTPFEAAERIAILDEESGGRISLYLDLSRAPGDLGHVGKLRCADEFVVLMRRFWANEEPITFEGNYYRCTDTLLRRKGPQGAAIPIWTSGLSGSAIQFAGRHADVFVLQPGSSSHVASQIDRIIAVRSEFGRACAPRFVLPVSAEAGDVAALPEALALSSDAVRAAGLLVSYVRIGVTDFAVSNLNDRSAISEFSLRLAAPIAELVRGGNGMPAEVFERSVIDLTRTRQHLSAARQARRIAP